MRREETRTPCEAAADPRGSLIGLIDYMLPEVRAAAPLAEYFMRLARAELKAVGEIVDDNQSEAS